MVSLTELKDIDDTSAIYLENLDEMLDQSAIYDKVLFEFLGKTYPAIILTPTCDIVTKKANYLTVAQIIPARWVYVKICMSRGLTDDQIAGVAQTEPNVQKSIKKDFVEHYMENRTYRYHYLPKRDKVFEDSFIDFQAVKTLYPKVLQEHKKIAALKSPWREAVPARYAAYCLRIGTPNYSKRLLDYCFAEITSKA